MTATIQRVARPRGELTPEQVEHLETLRAAANHARDEYRQAVVQVLTEVASFAEVSKVTGLSTNTIQRWKREAGQ